MLCGYVFFLFGWYVYEKVIFLVIILFSFIVFRDRCYFGVFWLLVVVGYVLLFLFLFILVEFLIKIVYIIFWLILFLMVFDCFVFVLFWLRFFLFDCFSMFYIIVSILFILYCLLLYGIIFGRSYEFFFFMFISLYLVIGVVGSWVGFLVVYFIL